MVTTGRRTANPSAIRHARTRTRIFSASFSSATFALLLFSCLHIMLVSFALVFFDTRVCVFVCFRVFISRGCCTNCHSKTSHSHNRHTCVPACISRVCRLASARPFQFTHPQHRTNVLQNHCPVVVRDTLRGRDCVFASLFVNRPLVLTHLHILVRLQVHHLFYSVVSLYFDCIFFCLRKIIKI